MTMQVWNGDIEQCLKWMHSNAPNIQSLITQKKAWYAKFHDQFWADWKESVFDLDTANNFGLMVWCIILGVPSQLFGLYPPDSAWGFGPNRQNFIGTSPGVVDPSPGGNFYGGGEFTLLTAQEIRWALKLRYAMLVGNARLEYINRMLNWIFNDGNEWDYGSGKYVYVTDSTGALPTYVNRITQPETWAGASVANVAIESTLNDAPYLGLTAYRCRELTGASVEHLFEPPIGSTVPPNSPFNASVYVKADGRSIVHIGVLISSVLRYAIFNLSSGMLISNDIPNSNPKITDVGNGWFRISCNIPGTSTTNDLRFGLCDDSGDPTYVGDGVSAALFWGGMAVEGSAIRPYMASIAPAIAAPPANAFRLDYHCGPNMNFSPQFINLLNAEQYGIIPRAAGSKTTVIQD